MTGWRFVELVPGDLVPAGVVLGLEHVDDPELADVVAAAAHNGGDPCSSRELELDPKRGA